MKVFLTIILFLFSCSEAWHIPQVRERSPTRLFETVQRTVMGIPEHLHKMKVSESFQHEESNVVLEKVSFSPPIFVLRNFLTTQECQHIMDSVTEMEPGQTVSNHGSQQRKNSHVAWIDNTDEVVVRDAAKRAHDIFLSQQQFFHESRGVEPLQVVRYDEGGEYVLHQDGNRRLLTVLYYLNGVGETWFPLADSSSENESTPSMNASRLLALKKCETLKPGQDGVLVSCEGGRGTAIQQGDAVAFYNYFTDATVDWNALHAGLPVSSTKWIGNHFYHHVPFSAVKDPAQ